jgi:uncharacterized protein YjbI with pentapeptide repeats
VDLTGARLSGVKLSAADLAGAILTGANLSDTDLDYPVCVRVDLDDGDLRGADLTDARLIGADLTDEVAPGRSSCQRRRGQSAPFANSIVRGVVLGTGRRPLEDGLR